MPRPHKARCECLGSRSARYRRRRDRGAQAHTGASRSPVAPSRSEAVVRRGHHRRRRARAGGRLLPRPGPRHHATSPSSSAAGWPAGTRPGTPRSSARNYLLDESAAIYEHSLKMWETLADELDYDLLFSQRGGMNLAHTPRRRPRGDAPRPRQSPERDRRRVARRSTTSRASARSSTSRPTPATRSSAPRTSRAAASRSTTTSRGPMRAPRTRSASTSSRAPRSPASTSRAAGSPASGPRAGRSRAGRVAIVAAGHASILAEMAGIRLPLQSHPLQALVSELLEPIEPTVVMSNAVHVYVSQAYKGELVIGAGHRRLERLRPAWLVPHHRAPAGRAGGALPDLRAARTCCGRGAASSTSRPDASPIIGLTPGRRPVPRLRLGNRRVQGDAGVGPRSSPTPSPTTSRTTLARPYGLERFTTGALIDEHGAAVAAH